MLKHNFKKTLKLEALLQVLYDEIRETQEETAHTVVLYGSMFS